MAVVPSILPLERHKWAHWIGNFERMRKMWLKYEKKFFKDKLARFFSKFVN